jgi:hypothetical protein
MTKKIINPLDKEFNLDDNNMEIIPASSSDTISTLIKDAHDDSASTDFEYARANFHSIIETAQDAMRELMEVAISSQNPRAFEVLSNHMKTILEANKGLLDLQKEIRDIKNKDIPQNQTALDSPKIQNNLFVGSTAELSKMLKELNNGNKKDSTD